MSGRGPEDGLAGLGVRGTGTRPGRLPPTSVVSTKIDRTCAEPECETRLSIYNLGERCWQHTPLPIPVRGKSLAKRRDGGPDVPHRRPVAPLVADISCCPTLVRGAHGLGNRLHRCR